MKLSNSNRGYRLGVVAVFSDESGQVLVAKRSGLEAWQFPQGGVDKEEKLKDALYREMLEELGNDNFKIVGKSSSLIPYDFPPDINSAITGKYRGQKQAWFLCRYHRGCFPNLKLATDHEFDAVAWVSVSEALDKVVYWKKEAYRLGLRQLGLIEEGG